MTVDVEFIGELPRGARPDLSVDGTIELERLDNVLYVGRPAFGQEQSTVGLFKFDPATGEAIARAGAARTKSSVNTIRSRSAGWPKAIRSSSPTCRRGISSNGFACAKVTARRSPGSQPGPHVSCAQQLREPGFSPARR